MSVPVAAAGWDGLDAAMAETGCWPARSPWIREAMARLPRHHFAAERLWRWDGRAYLPVDRAADPDGWAAQVYGSLHDAAITRLDGGLPSSSLSAPSIVADMLDALRVEPGHRVLELGTGMGWNAALLAHRAGAGRVVSVEVDGDLAAAARERVARAGVAAAVEVGDGGGGWPAGAPFDRVIATYAVEEIPWAWVEQTVPGGRIVAPWGQLGHVVLTVAADGRSASGRVRGLARFMADRAATGPLAWRQVRGEGPARWERPLTREVAPLHGDWHLRFALRVAMPGARVITRNEGGAVTAWVHDGVSSWATLDGSAGMTWGGGPRDLWAELDRAWTHWTEAGAPDYRDFGLTVDRDAGQTVWCGDPAAGPYWPAT